mmetsp:Transcript_30021/g.100375  ORF Transcript_30021/g.100375 Transcript_30021/m.100375 type:complete len:226 (+) Transcript_30021:401-1078(+)
MRLTELQSAAATLDLVARLPPPASYCTHTARFLLLWLATLPLVLVDLFSPLVIPPIIFGVGWALYSTEELAKLLDEPFGRASDTQTVRRRRLQLRLWRRRLVSTVRGVSGGGDGGDDAAAEGEGVGRSGGRWDAIWELVEGGGSMPEAVPVGAYCDRIVTELQQQIGITRLLQRRVDGDKWAVTADDLEYDVSWRVPGGGEDADADALDADALEDEYDEVEEGGD